MPAFHQETVTHAQNRTGLTLARTGSRPGAGWCTMPRNDGRRSSTQSGATRGHACIAQTPVRGQIRQPRTDTGGARATSHHRAQDKHTSHQPAAHPSPTAASQAHANAAWTAATQTNQAAQPNHSPKVSQNTRRNHSAYTHKLSLSATFPLTTATTQLAHTHTPHTSTTHVDCYRFTLQNTRQHKHNALTCDFVRITDNRHYPEQTRCKHLTGACADGGHDEYVLRGAACSAHKPLWSATRLALIPARVGGC